MVLYEYPFNESIRTMLRLEHMFDRLGQLMARTTPVDHHYALATIFEIMDVASRADLKSDLLKELERHKSQLAGYRGNPSISEAALDDVIARIDHAFAGLNQLAGKAGHALTGNEWLMSIRSRISIPGGTCEFDLPAYYAWQQHDAARRQADLAQWSTTLMPLAEALQVLLALFRHCRPVPAKPRAGPELPVAALADRPHAGTRPRNQRPPPDGADSPDASGCRRAAEVQRRRCKLRTDPVRVSGT